MYTYIFQQAMLTVSSKKTMPMALLLALLSSSALTWAEVDFSQQKQSSSAEPSAMSFIQVLEKVRRHQSKLGTWQVQQSMADAHMQQSRVWENPTFSVQQTGFNADQDRELEFGISQKLDVFGERKAATKLAQLQRQQVDLNQTLYEAQLELAVKNLWSQVVIFEMENQIAQRQLANSRDILEATRLRYQAGSIAQVDQDRTLMTHIENQRAAQEVELNLNIARKRLANLWGETGNTFSLDAKNQNVWPKQNKADVADDLKQNLFQRTIQLQLQQQRSNVDYLKAKRRPNPTLNVGMVNSKSADSNNREQQFRVGLEIPLNIFDRQQYSLQIAQIQQDFLLQQQRFYSEQNLNHIETLQSELTGLKQQYDLMSDQQIPLSEEVQRKMLVGFKVGKYAITDVQQATAQLQEQRLKKVQLLKSAWQKAIETESLALGIVPEQVMSSDAINQMNRTLWQNTRNFNVISGAE
ncbi:MULTISPECIES: TolC family protein [unclassified Acinetobacter]|uniref:TolC family protein n=1 Tax=unclassified Acinetobacter TaxID=196816 RepID=UPI00190D6547|nr:MULTISPECIES: TolC family protein [unclassified Acinetobacter]MBK0062903.1 TolC family protein [Acinetobacter sp. S55]MBK0065520.1 TolC family protein [Acinetobacter sp. S54]